MSWRMTSSIGAGVWLTIVLLSNVASSQIASDRLASIRSRLESVKTFSRRLSPRQRMMLSGSTLNFFELAEKWDNIEPNQGKPPIPLDEVRRKLSAPAAAPQATNALVPVSNPASDFLLSVLGGFTQSETSTAWCGPNVVVGFNDSGSVIETLFLGAGGLSFTGAAFSNTQGASFRDIGFVNPGPNPTNLLLGDPVVACQDSNTFRYSQLFATGSASSPRSAVALSSSFDGGVTWGNPVTAVSKDAFTHTLDKDWMALDPTDSKRIFVTYTDFDLSGVCGFASGAPIERVAIELVRSTDGGVTWSSPLIIDQVCSLAPDFPFDQGSQVAVGPKGEVYVAWESFVGGLNPILASTRQIDIRKSVNHGEGFQSTVKVDDVICVGDCFAIQGYFRTFLDLQALVVDRSGARTNGNVYVAWHDGRNFNVTDLESPNGVYGYADALISRSNDGGATWSSAVRINSNPIALSNGRGTDQFMPGIAVDKTGAVGACWYDRSLDPLNFLVDRFCGISTDGGTTFTSTRETPFSWVPLHGTDGFLNPSYMGDYDGVASDFLQHTSGFIGAFQIMNSGPGIFVPNPDVFAANFP